jgi:phosphoglycerate dehydrogenase-like enzyme
MQYTTTRICVLSAAIGALALFATGSSRAADDAGNLATIMKELRVEEDSTPVRERKNWRAPKKIVVLGSADKLAGAVPGAQLIAVPNAAAARAAAKDADVLVGFNTTGICDREMLDGAQQLRWISSLSAGVELCMAVASVRERDLLVTNMRGVESASIAEHAMAMALALAHSLDTFHANQAQGKWDRGGTARMQVLSGKTLLVVGLGGIGTEIAERAHGIGMKVIATRNSGRTGPDFVSYVGLADEMGELAKTADVIVNAAPLTPETTGLFNAKFFATLKPNALFINIARGKSVVTADLVDALKQGRIAGAGLDVVDPEPLPPNHPLWHTPNVIITPHISSAGDVSDEALWTLARENLRRYAAGEKMLSVVDLKRGY